MRSAVHRHFAGMGDLAESESAINPTREDLTPQVQRVRRPLWIDPPRNWENLDLISYALLPAIGSTVVIVSFQVPAGRNGIVRLVGNNFVGGGWIEGTGDVKWRILVDSATPPGASSYNSIVASLGSPANPVSIAGFRIYENQLLTLVAFNDPAGPNGGVVVAGQRVGGRLAGYLYPREAEDPSIF
jgi:hypothetical protein